jgi:Tripartite tricarboxylate transporter TctB family
MAKRASLILALGILALAAAAVFTATDWPLKAKLFPLVIGIPLVALAFAETLFAVFSKEPSAEPSPPEGAARRTLVAWGWMLGSFAAIVLIGFQLAVPAFVFLYLVVQGRERWLFSAIFAAAVWALFYGLFDALLHLPFPPGLILEWLGLAIS